MYKQGKTCLNEAYGQVRVRKYLIHSLLSVVRNQEMLYSHCLSNLKLEYFVWKVQANQEGVKLNAIHQLMIIYWVNTCTV
jgi:hypothetical protein